MQINFGKHVDNRASCSLETLVRGRIAKHDAHLKATYGGNNAISSNGFTGTIK